MSRRAGAIALAALALAAPGSAFAQSAGDDQYQDPFAGDNGSQNDGGSGGGDTGGSTGGGDTGGSTGGSGGTPTPAPAPAAPATPAAESGTTVPTETVASTLPRTGRDAEWVLGLGLLLIAAGAGLRRLAAAGARP